MAKGRKPTDLSGKRFGDLTALYIDRTRDWHKGTYWVCQCDCGNTKSIRRDKLVKGITKSCGCKHFEACKTHGKTNTKLYAIWRTMKARCTNKNNEKYERYGGRGIKICDEWAKDFQTFFDWAINNGYSEGLTIDSINNDGNYEPSNCRWTTPMEQSYNKSNTVHINYNGKRITLKEAAEISGLSKSLIAHRIRRGWSVKDAIELPKITTLFKKHTGE